MATHLTPTSTEARRGDSAILAAMARARPLLEEVLSLWPAEERSRLVLWVDVAGPALEIKARLRDGDAKEGRDSVARQVHRVKRDVAVVIELEGKDPVVLPWRSLREAA
jgi:hypothetical protein